MTLEDSIHRVLETHKSLRPSEIISILKSMPEYKSKAEGDWFKVNVSKALKNLRKKKIVKITEDKHAFRKFALTEKGEKMASQVAISNIVNLPIDVSMKVDYPGILRPSVNRGKLNDSALRVLETLDQVQPKGVAFMDVGIWLDKAKGKNSNLPNNAQEKLQQRISDSVRLFGSSFIQPIKEANIQAKNAVYGWKGFDAEPQSLQKLIDQQRAALDFEAVVVIRFNGRKIVNDIDWNKEIAKVKELDKKAAESFEKHRQAVTQKGPEQQNWLTDKIIESIGDSEFELKKFLAVLNPLFSDEINRGPWGFLGNEKMPKEKLVNEFVDRIVFKKKYSIDKSTGDLMEDEEITINYDEIRSEVEKVVQELIDDGDIEITPVYLFKLKDKQKALKKMWKAREGYPDPAVANPT